MAHSPASASIQSTPFIKHLASSDRKTRLRALHSLRTYLSIPRPSTRPWTLLDFQKLWKGLFYCLWMQDKPLHQQNLAREFASLVDVLLSVVGKKLDPEREHVEETDEKIDIKGRGVKIVCLWYEAFWSTMAREWENVDRLRLDKFLYLVRCLLGKGFEICLRRNASRSDAAEVVDADVDGDNELGEAEEHSAWTQGDISAYLRTLTGGPLNPRDGKMPNGLRHHVVDIYFDELSKAAEATEFNLGSAANSDITEMFITPLRQLRKETRTESVRKRLDDALADERIETWTSGVGLRGDEGKPRDSYDQDEVQENKEGDDEFGGFED